MYVCIHAYVKSTSEFSLGVCHPCCSYKTSWPGRISKKKAGSGRPTKCQAGQNWKWDTTDKQKTSGKLSPCDREIVVTMIFVTSPFVVILHLKFDQTAALFGWFHNSFCSEQLRNLYPFCSGSASPAEITNNWNRWITKSEKCNPANTSKKLENLFLPRGNIGVDKHFGVEKMRRFKLQCYYCLFWIFVIQRYQSLTTSKCSTTAKKSVRISELFTTKWVAGMLYRIQIGWTIFLHLPLGLPGPSEQIRTPLYSLQHDWIPTKLVAWIPKTWSHGPLQAEKVQRPSCCKIFYKNHASTSWVGSFCLKITTKNTFYKTGRFCPSKLQLSTWRFVGALASPFSYREIQRGIAYMYISM